MKAKSVLLKFVLPILSIIIIVVLSFCFCQRSKKKVEESREVKNGHLFEIWSYDGKMVYESIIDAMDGFNDKCIIWEGGSETVYKGELPSGQVFAIKKIHDFKDIELSCQKGFTSEIHALTEIHHRNIVKLFGFCLHPRHSFLVYEFLEGGSWEKILSSNDEAVQFD